MPIASPPNSQTTYLQQGNQQVLVSWNIVPGATSYNVYRNTTGIAPTLPATPHATVTEAQYLDTSALLNTQYWY
jgi:hypothetical protein